MHYKSNVCMAMKELLISLELLNDKFNQLSKENLSNNDFFTFKKITITVNELDFYVTSAFNLMERPIDLLKQLKTAQIQTQFLLVILKPLIDKRQNCILILRDINQLTIDINGKIENVILAIP